MRVHVLAAGLMLGAASGAHAQAREVERYDFDSSEGRLLGFYSAALAFSSLGPARPLRTGALEVGLEAAYVPYLTREQRTAGSDKPQSSNLAPAFPRPRVALILPGSFRAEASWMPPVRVFDAEANLLGLALSRPVGDVTGTLLIPRLSVLTGRIEGPITCNDDLASGTLDQQVYFGTVCHGNESEDHFEPLHLTAELLASRSLRDGTVIPYASAGVRHERVEFDIGVIRADGSRDPDHPVLEMRATRPFAILGAQWRPTGLIVTGSELFFAPGSLVTVRVLAALRFRAQ